MPSITKTVQQVCAIDDLRVEIIATVYVDENGDALNQVESSNLYSDRPYFCVGPCEQDFATWEEARAHLAAQEAA
jgi:hypothetical protein